MRRGELELVFGSLGNFIGKLYYLLLTSTYVLINGFNIIAKETVNSFLEYVCSIFPGAFQDFYWKLI